MACFLVKHSGASFSLLLVLLTYCQETVLLDHPFQQLFKPFFHERQKGIPGYLFGSEYTFNSSNCRLPETIKHAISGYSNTVQKILDTVLTGNFKGRSFDNVAEFVDQFGRRNPGSEAVDNALSFLEEKMKSIGMTVWSEPLEVPGWSRGEEKAKIVEPIEWDLQILGLGRGAETPPEGITAPVIVVHDFDDVETRDVNGKIVVFNSPTRNAHEQLLLGPTVAAKKGAVGILCRSPVKALYAATFDKEANSPSIPGAVLTQNDADKIERMFRKHPDHLRIWMKMRNQTEQRKPSRNLIGDFVGNDNKDEFVMSMSHADSWDQGEGVQDNAIGLIMNIEIIQLLQQLGLHPRRTIRNIIFSSEELGIDGATRWTQDHASELETYSTALEIDMGCVRAAGWVLQGEPEAACIVSEIVKLFGAATNATHLAVMSAVPSNALPLHQQTGLPTISFNGDDDQGMSYWEVQHTNWDTMATANSTEWDKCLAALASMTYVVADLRDKLPRKRR